jgi:hypothetical protein
LRSVAVRPANGEPFRDGVPFSPEVYFDGSYHPVCALGFSDNNEGATTLCQSLGLPILQYEGDAVTHGTVQRTNMPYEVDAMPVGTCLAGEALDSCTAGDNAFGNFAYEDGSCGTGAPVGLEISCHSQVRRLSIRFLFVYTHLSDALVVCGSVCKDGNEGV